MRAPDGRKRSLENACEKHNLIYARYTFSNDFAKFEDKTGTIKIR